MSGSSGLAWFLAQYFFVVFTFEVVVIVLRRVILRSVSAA
jgi:uncharacterized membrane protein